MSTLNNPSGVFVSNGEVFIADTFNDRVRKLLRNGQIVTIAGVPDSRNQSVLLTKLIKKPVSVFVSSSDQVYISEWQGQQIRKIDRNGVMTTIAGSDVIGCSGDGQLAVNALLNCPYGLFVTDDEEILFCDTGNNCVRKIDRHGIISTIAGNRTSGFNGDGQLATSACLNFPTSVFQYEHEIYIADSENNRLRKIDRNGMISTIAGNGDDGYNGDGILATKASLHPHFIYVHNDQIYISDIFNYSIRKIDQNGIITTIAGTGECGYNGDGQLAIHAQLDDPSGICVDVDSQIYITDSRNHCIRKIDQNGIISTIAGTGEKGYSGDVPFDFKKYPHIGPRKKPKIKPFPHAYHDVIIYCNDFNSTTWTEYEPLTKKTKFN